MFKPGVTILAMLLLLGNCAADENDKYIPRSERRKEKYATPEPGTYLKPAAYSLLKKINQILEDPDHHQMPTEWMVKMFTAPQKRLLDTTLRYMDHEVEVRIYYPTKESMGGNQPVVLFFHGGGFILGSVEQYHIMVSKMARITGYMFVSVEYRLAPQYPFPAAIMDCFSVLQWLQNYGDIIGADKSKICVMGDSAGGNIATVLTLLSRDNQVPQPMCQVLLYPGVTFLETPYPSRLYFAQTTGMSYILNDSFLRRVKQEYMGEGNNEGDPYLSPLEAELTGDLAPALIITAECDPIRDGGRLYADKLEKAGVTVTHMEYSGMIHGFMSFHMILSDALDAMKLIRSYLDQQ
jgi:acetyl esterase